MKLRVLTRGLVLLCGLALLGYLFGSSELGSRINETWINAQVRGHGITGALLFMLVGGLLTAIGLPRQVVAFLGGYAFGMVAGALIGAATALIGCILSFSAARLLGRGLLRNRLGARAARFDRFIHDHPFAMTVLVRLLPMGSNLLTSLAAGISSIRPAVFFAASFIGYLPQSLAFALVGSGVQVDPASKLAFGAALLLVSAALGAWLYRRYRHGLSLDARIDAALDETAPDQPAARRVTAQHP